MRVFGVIGWKNSGKTHLMVRLISEITARGYSVSSIKHAHHSLTLPTKDADGREQCPPGALETIFASPERWSLIKETPEGMEADTLSELLARLEPVDIVLVEGYKLESHPKLEAYRAGSKRDLIARADDRVVAIASDTVPDGIDLPVLDLDNTSAIADFILAFFDLPKVAGQRAQTHAT